MLLPKQYDPQVIAEKWYAQWQAKGFFAPQPNPTQKPYSTILPPFNITGDPHCGHALIASIQDILVRRARMLGKETCWVPGIDHAAIATEAKVVAMLQKQGVRKSDLTKEEFLVHAWEWKKKYGSRIFDQLKQLGISCDWQRAQFTLDPHISESVTQAFINLYEQGYIYQDTRMIHWDPLGQTALSDEEVVYQEVAAKLYYIQYPLVNSNETVTIATTRPETIFGDTALCVHPTDKRYQQLIGKKVHLPLSNRIIPIIADDHVDKEMGTGCLKITPAHDFNDYAIGKRHHLATINIMHSDGILNAQAGNYAGLSILEARRKVVEALTAEGILTKISPHNHQVGFSERTQAVVEPRISTQWFVRMQELAAPALQSVLDGTIQFYPSKYKRTYQAWMNNIRDWCISRQLWWGHPIPVYYLPDKQFVVASSLAEALMKARKLTSNQNLIQADLTQDKDVLDTWFSSWLWPLAVFDGIRKPSNADFTHYYPTDDLVTGPDIIFFWVARMIMAGHAFANKIPFKNVYFTGIVRDKKRQKMSKCEI